MSEKEEPKTEKKNNDFAIGSHHSDRNGWVRFHIWGANCKIVFQTLRFCLTQLDFYFYLGSYSLQTVPPREQF